MTPDQQNQRTVEQQGADVHLPVISARTTDKQELIRTGYWRGYSVEVFCRSDQNHWVPYHVSYPPDASEHQ